MYWNDDQSGRMNFDLVSQAYEIGRPPYPSTVFDSTFSRMDARPVTLEVGSGSGQATGELAARSKHLDCVEPGERFASHLQGKFGDLDSVEIVRNDFEDFTATRSYDLVFSGSALHWVPKDVALSKIEKLLKAGGWLVAVWTQLAIDTSIRELLDKEVGSEFADIPLPVYEPDVHEARFSEGLRDLCGNWDFHSCSMSVMQQPRAISIRTFVALLESYADVAGRSEEDVNATFLRIASALTGAKLSSITVLDYFSMAVAQRS